MSHVKFNKPSLSIAEQLALLESRGMKISDRDEAYHALSVIGYYRLSGYWYPYQLRNNSSSKDYFKPDTDFHIIKEIYDFDFDLRHILIEALEVIEIAIRIKIINKLSEKYGPHWHLDNKLFKENFDHEKFLSDIYKENGIKPFDPKKQTLFIKSYLEKYKDPEQLPCWMLFELISFGRLSLVYKSLLIENKSLIAKDFEFPWKRLESWLHACTYLRNLCAHHCRIWNTQFNISPSVSKNKRGLFKEKSFFLFFMVLRQFLQLITDDSVFMKKFKILLEKYPSIPIDKMGFPYDWNNCSLKK